MHCQARDTISRDKMEHVRYIVGYDGLTGNFETDYNPLHLQHKWHAYVK